MGLAGTGRGGREVERRRWGRSRGGRRDGGLARGWGCARARDGTSRSGGRRGPGPRRGTGRARAHERRSARRPRGSRVKFLGRTSSSGAGGMRQTAQARRAERTLGARGGACVGLSVPMGIDEDARGREGGSLTSRGGGHVSARRRDEHQTTPEMGWKPCGRRRWPRCGARTRREGVPVGTRAARQKPKNVRHL